MVNSSITMDARIVDSAFPITVSSASITLDEFWTPYVRAEITCPLTDRALIAEVNPLKDVQIWFAVHTSFGVENPISDISAIYAGKSMADITDYLEEVAPFNPEIGLFSAMFWDSFDPTSYAYKPRYSRFMKLSLRSRTIDHKSQTVAMTCSSEESLLMDDANISNGPIDPPGAALWELTNYVLGRSGRMLGDASAAALLVSVNEELRPWKPGVSAYDYMYSHVRQSGLFLWADEGGMWHLREKRAQITTVFALSPTENVTNGTDTISRDADWYTAAVVTYTWTDADNKTHEQFDSYFDTQIPARVYTETINAPYPGPGRAEALVRTFLGNGRTNTVDAVADYSITPAQPAVIDLPGTPSQQGSISSVTWNFPADTMSVTTRSTRDY